MIIISLIKAHNLSKDITLISNSQYLNNLIFLRVSKINNKKFNNIIHDLYFLQDINQPGNTVIIVVG